MLWFVVLGAIGVLHIAQQPGILAALNPLHAWDFLAERGWHLFAAVGAIVLALTGAEALYADMGHFGRKPIQLAWTGLVLPGLALNYLGQGALLMGDPSAIENPFYRLFPDTWVLPAAGAGDAGGHHRFAGRDFRRVFDDEAGHPAGLSAAHGDPLHLGA